jgi:antitoxin (DNA-binding transcriptional repressor) of toxin-antitoxin stability system
MVTMSVGDAKSRFSEMISRAAAGERFVIERCEKPVAVLISILWFVGRSTGVG